MGASSRVRYYQYLPYLREQGLEVSVEPFLTDAYLSALYAGRSRVKEVFLGYVRRLRALISTHRFNLLVVEKEIFPFFPAWFEQALDLLGVPYVVDYDDAWFHRYEMHEKAPVRWMLGRKIDKVMQHGVVIAGNSYLAERALKSGARRVEVIPTVVDTDRYQLRSAVRSQRNLVVGWIGTPQTSHYLRPLLPVFEALRSEISVRFIAVGANPDDFVNTPVEAQEWTEDSEVAAIQKFDIGIMPLEDSPWERGKCGYKLIQYMACGVPVIASPVGVNNEIVVNEVNGLLPKTIDDWEKSLRKLLFQDEANRRTMGRAGRERVERWYSLDVQAPRFLSVLRDAVL